MDAFKHHHPRRGHSIDEIGGFCELLMRDEDEVSGRLFRSLFLEPVGCGYGGADVLTLHGAVADEEHRLWMDIVGQSEQHSPTGERVEPEPSEPPRVQLTELAISVVGCALIHHIVDEAKGKRRVNAIAAAVSETQKPNPRATNQPHK